MTQLGRVPIPSEHGNTLNMRFFRQILLLKILLFLLYQIWWHFSNQLASDVNPKKLTLGAVPSPRTLLILDSIKLLFTAFIIQFSKYYISNIVYLLIKWLLWYYYLKYANSDATAYTTHLSVAWNIRQTKST